MGHDFKHSGLSYDRPVHVLNSSLQLLTRFNSSIPYQTFKLLRPTSTAFQELPAVRESGDCMAAEYIAPKALVMLVIE
jgi:hypothetical protein